MGKISRFLILLVFIAGFTILPGTFAAEITESSGPEFGGQWIWALFSLIVVVFLAYWATRLLAGRLNVSQARHIKVAESLCLGPNRHLYLLLVNNQVMLLGSSEHGITLLKEYTDDTFYEVLSLTQGNTATLPAEKFKQVFLNLLHPEENSTAATDTDFAGGKQKLAEGLERLRAWRKRR